MKGPARASAQHWAFWSRWGLGTRLCALTTAFGLGSLFILAVIHHHRVGQLRTLFERQAEEERARLLSQIELEGRTLANFAYDYTYWDDMVTFVRKPRPSWAAENIRTPMESFQIDGVWIFDASWNLLHQSRRDEALPLPFGRRDLEGLSAEGLFAHGFVPTPAGLAEFRLAPVQPGADAARASPPAGWMLAVRIWSGSSMQQLERLSGLRLEFLGSGEEPLPARLEEARISFVIDLPGAGEEPAARLHAVKYIPVVTAMARQNLRATLLAALANAGFFGMLLIVVHFACGRPLRTVVAAAQGQAAPGFEDLFRRDDEIGHLATLVRSMRSSQARLEHENRRRQEAESQLQQALVEQDIFARELHDDTLQSLYAMGMVLDGTQRTLGADDHPAGETLAPLVPEINRLIATLRVAIAGMERTQADPQRLAQTLTRILESVCRPAGLSLVSEIDPATLGRLSREQTFHLVRIVRELASNAARHAGGNHFRFALQHRGNFVIIEAEDDGQGFEPDEAGLAGHGLANLRKRCQAMNAAIRWEAAQPRGTRAVIEIAPTQAHDPKSDQSPAG